MKEFMDLRTFMLLGDLPGDNRPFSVYMTGPDWLKLYDCAKASWDQYGDQGPPIGSKVESLRAGHGNFRSGAIRTFEGIYDLDSRFFTISRQEVRLGKEE